MKDVSDPSNSRLFETGQLQVARFNSDGSTTWLAVNPETPVYPFLPSRFSDADLGCPLELPHSDRQRTGGELFHEDAVIQAYRRRIAALADFIPVREKRPSRERFLLMLTLQRVRLEPPKRPALRTPKNDPIAGDLLLRSPLVPQTTPGALILLSFRDCMVRSVGPMDG